MLKSLPILLCFLLTCLCFTACNKAKLENNLIVVQPDIVNNPVYKKLDKQNEPLDISSYLHKIKKPKTSDVSYSTDNNSSSKYYTCHANVNNGALKINIGMSGFFGGRGFDIICVNNKYTIKPYLVTDVVGIPEPKTTYQIIKQSLILNKAKYVVGDSIYGYLDFKLIENQKITHDNGGIDMIEDQKITHIGKGYFRGKID